MSPLLESVVPLLEPGEQPRYVITGQTGIKPSFRWISFWLVIANKARIVVVTDRRIAVLKGGQLRWKRSQPKALLYSLPRSTPIKHGTRGWTKVQLGNELIWISRSAYPVMDKANAEIAQSDDAVRPTPTVL